MNYPDKPNNGPTKLDPNPRKKKKGKQKEDMLDGLLQIDDLADPQNNRTAILDPNQRKKKKGKQRQEALDKLDDLTKLVLASKLAIDKT